PGHGSLDDALHAAWRGLTAAERDGLAVLAAFHGGFDLDGATAVLGAPAIGLVAGLRARSWLAPSLSVDAEPRYALLGSLRRFVEDTVSAERVTAGRRAHAAWCAAVGAGPIGAAIRERENLGRALDLVGDDPRPEVAIALWRGSARVVFARGPSSEAERLVERVGRWSTAAPGSVDGLLLEAARLAGRFGLFAQAGAALAAADAAAAAGPDPERLERAVIRGHLAMSTGDLAAARVAYGAVSGDPTAPAELRRRATSGQVKVLRDAGALAEARALCTATLVDPEAGPDAHEIARYDLGMIAFAEGRPELAEAAFREVLAADPADLVVRQAVDRALARVVLERGDAERAAAVFAVRLSAARDPTERAICACDLAAALAELGRVDEAVALVDGACERLERIGDRRSAAIALVVRGELAQRAGDPTTAAVRFDGARTSVPPGSELAGVAGLFGAVALAEAGRPDEAAATLDEVRAFARSDLVARAELALALFAGRPDAERRSDVDGPRDLRGRWLDLRIAVARSRR
ncbi:MAG: tetratricopeptide repeat protein, partial [Myxococcota bacterium]